MRLSLFVAAALIACQAGWLLDRANAQEKGKDKGPPTTQKPTLTPGPGEQKKAVAIAPGDPGFDFESWKRQWAVVEAEMKSMTRSNDVVEGRGG